MNESIMQKFQKSDKAAFIFLILALSYLLLGLLIGSIGSFQYILPEFLKEALAFQKTRPLHVYLVITWIFSATQAVIYYYLPRIAERKLFWENGIYLHLWIQALCSFLIIVLFFNGNFGGREYLEFPPIIGFFILLSWIPFAVNFFATLKPNYSKAPVYIWSWSTGIVFFFITLSESYLWKFDFFSTNIIRDITVQWKAMGSMVGSWNMLIYGTAMYVMEKVTGDTKQAQSKISFFFYFLGAANLMFNWGHHTYIVPAKEWVQTLAYAVSMTELLILGFIIWQWKKRVKKAIKYNHSISYRLLSFADVWIFLNLILAIAISIPSVNYFTHGTHITVAHAMGATVGINTMLLFASIMFIIRNENIVSFEANKKNISINIVLLNVGLLLFWISLLGSGLVKIAGKFNNRSFASIMQDSSFWFVTFAFSGLIVLIALSILALISIIQIRKILKLDKTVKYDL